MSFGVRIQRISGKANVFRLSEINVISKRPWWMDWAANKDITEVQYVIEMGWIWVETRNHLWNPWVVFWGMIDFGYFKQRNWAMVIITLYSMLTVIPDRFLIDKIISRQYDLNPWHNDCKPNTLSDKVLRPELQFRIIHLDLRGFWWIDLQI